MRLFWRQELSSHRQGSRGERGRHQQAEAAGDASHQGLRQQDERRRQRDGLLLGIALLVVWAVAFLVYHVASWAIHLLIIAALIAIAIDVFRWVRAKV